MPRGTLPPRHPPSELCDYFFPAARISLSTAPPRPSSCGSPCNPPVIAYSSSGDRMSRCRPHRAKKAKHHNVDNGNRNNRRLKCCVDESPHEDECRNNPRRNGTGHAPGAQIRTLRVREPATQNNKRHHLHEVGNDRPPHCNVEHN